MLARFNPKDVTDSTDPEVLAIKKQFHEILATKPAPEIKKMAKSAKPKKKEERVKQARGLVNFEGCKSFHVF